MSDYELSTDAAYQNLLARISDVYAIGQCRLIRLQENLWPLLLVIASRKAAKLRIRERRQKRGGGKQLIAADFNDEFSPLRPAYGLQ